MEIQRRASTTDSERPAATLSNEKLEENAEEGGQTADTPSEGEEEAGGGGGGLPSSTVTTASPIPNGGLQAWLVAAGTWVILVNTWGVINTFGVYQTYYSADLLSSHSSSDISWIGSLQASLLFLAGIAAGPLHDRGFFRTMTLVGLFMILFGQFMLSLCTEYWQVLLAQGICSGTGMGLAFLPATAILAQYFSGGKRALAIGLSYTGSPIGGIIFPIIFTNLQPRVGFAWATRIIAFIMLGLSVVPVTCMRTRVPVSRRAHSILDFTALRDLDYLFFTFASCFAFLIIYVPFFYMPLYSVMYGGVGASFAPYLVTLLNVGNTLGRVLFNVLSKPLGGLNTLTVCAIVGAALLFAWMGIRDEAGLCVFAVLYGAFSGGIVTLNPSIVVELSPDLNRVGARMAVNFMFAGIAVLIGTPIAGAILGNSSQSEWFGTIGYAGAGLSIAALLYALARFLLYKRTGTLVA